MPTSPKMVERAPTREPFRISDLGDKKLADFKGPDVKNLYDVWGGKDSPVAHELTTRFRGLINFGVSILGDPECERLAVILHNSRFKMKKRPSVGLTAEQVIAIRKMAWKMERPSIALAQAFQFDCKLRQKDVIGEWVPIIEQGSSDIFDQNNSSKWLRGIRWNQIDENCVLRHTASIDGKEIEIDLRRDAPMVMEEFCKAAGLTSPGVITSAVVRQMLPTSGPLIAYEGHGLPWAGSTFRVEWRKIADACDIPKNVSNRDSRSNDEKSSGPRVGRLGPRHS